jgi:hypothetical protein
MPTREDMKVWVPASGDELRRADFLNWYGEVLANPRGLRVWRVCSRICEHDVWAARVLQDHFYWLALGGPTEDSAARVQQDNPIARSACELAEILNCTQRTAKRAARRVVELGLFKELPPPFMGAKIVRYIPLWPNILRAIRAAEHEQASAGESHPRILVQVQDSNAAGATGMSTEAEEDLRRLIGAAEVDDEFSRAPALWQLGPRAKMLRLFPDGSRQEFLTVPYVNDANLETYLDAYRARAASQGQAGVPDLIGAFEQFYGELKAAGRFDETSKESGKEFDVPKFSREMAAVAMTQIEMMVAYMEQTTREQFVGQMVDRVLDWAESMTKLNFGEQRARLIELRSPELYARMLARRAA